METNETIVLRRSCAAVMIPSGEGIILEEGTPVRITQSLGGCHTVVSDHVMALVDRKDADALGFEQEEPVSQPGIVGAPGQGTLNEEQIWGVLRNCYDPEIPVNIVDLGLVYDLAVEKTAGGHTIEVKMTLTAPGCGMGPTIAEDARQKIAALPTVEAAKVHIVWDPIWTPQMISPEGRKVLGLE